MSSSQVTLKELIQKWAGLTTQSDEFRWEEMQVFFEEASQAGITSADILRLKEPILRVWCPITWAEAKKLNPNWVEKAWYDKRKRGTLRTFDKWFADYRKAEKAATPIKPKQQSEAPKVAAPAPATPPIPFQQVAGDSYTSDVEEEYYSQFEVFTTHQQVLNHTKEWQAQQAKLAKGRT